MIAVAKDIRRPALIYLGGKWKLAPWLLKNFPPHRTYVEPFGGGASVLLRKAAARYEIYNDLNGDLVNLFRVLRDPEQGPRLVELIRLTPFSRAEFFDAYESTEDPVERARRIIVRSFMGHGTNSVFCPHRNGFRSKEHKAGSPPSRSWGNYPESLAQICERFRGVTVECEPASKVIERYDSPDTLFYVDPPYVESTRTFKLSRAKTFYPHEIDDAGHVALAEQLHAVQGMVVLSGYASPLYDHLYGDWVMRKKRAYTYGALKRTECAWFNLAAWIQRHKVDAP